jgi:hypothetical protein
MAEANAYAVEIGVSGSAFRQGKMVAFGRPDHYVIMHVYGAMNASDILAHAQSLVEGYKMGCVMMLFSKNGSGSITLQISGKDDHNFESVPDAIAACRRHFMEDSRTPCKALQDHLVYSITVSEKWNGVGLP